MAQQTAVEWLITSYHDLLLKSEINNTHYSIVDEEKRKLFEKAKLMHKEQMIRFAITCHQNILRERKAHENLISENLLLFLHYYNETYNK